MTDNIPDLIESARHWPNPYTNPTMLIGGLADALEAEHKRAEGLLVDLDARFEHSDHTAAKYYQRMREAEQERDRAKSGAHTLGEIVVRQVVDTLRWAGMEDQIGTNDPDQQLAWDLCAEMPGKITALTAERDRYRAAIEQVRAMLPGSRTFAESLSRDFEGNLWPRTIDADRVAEILTHAPNENGETDGA